MLLSDIQIHEAVTNGDIQIDPFEETQIQPATYDLRVGDQGATTSSKEVVDIKKRGYLSLEPGDFGVITILEEIRLGLQYAGRFGLKSKYSRKGLIATTGLQIDPGYHGRLFIGITNLTPRFITLPYGDEFLSVEFHKLDEPASKPYDGPYQDRVNLGPEEIRFITESESMSLSEVLTTLRCLSDNVGELSKDLLVLTTEFRKYKWVVPLIVAIGITVIGIIVGLK